MSILISGSIAIDNILSYGSRFSDHLIAGSLDHINLSFVTDSMTRNYGGCAVNIAYSLKLLGGDPYVLGAVGTDGNDYLYRLDELDIRHGIVKLNDTYTAQCFVTTDTTGAQIATFNPGAMLRAHEAKFPKEESFSLALIGPDGREAMLQRANELTDNHIPFIFDIGQGATLFKSDEIKAFIEKADYVAASAYELDIITHVTGWTESDVASRVAGLIVTYGEKGSKIVAEGKTIDVAASPVSNALDPVGAGDAFRGGLLFGMSRNWSWEDTLGLASVMGSFKVQSLGAQNFKPTKEQICERFASTYGRTIAL